MEARFPKRRGRNRYYSFASIFTTILLCAIAFSAGGVLMLMLLTEAFKK